MHSNTVYFCTAGRQLILPKTRKSWTLKQ